MGWCVESGSGAQSVVVGCVWVCLATMEIETGL